MHYSKRLGSLLVATLGLLASRPGGAAPTSSSAPNANSEPSHLADDKALQTFKEGIAAFDQRDFEAARVAFLQTLALKPTAPVVRRNLGLAEIYSGHYLDGARRLARVLHTTGEGTAEDRARMLESLKKAEAYLERLTIEVNEEGAEVEIDGVDLGPSPVPFVWYVAPGAYEVRVDKAGFQSFRESRQARAGGTQHLRILLIPPSVPARARSATPSPRFGLEKHPKGWVLASGGMLTAAGLVAGVAFSRAASKNGDKAELLTERLKGTGCSPPGMPECTELADAWHTHDRQWRVATASFVAAGVSGLVTLIYGLFGGDYEPAEPEQASLRSTPLGVGSLDGHGPYARWQTAF
jgi:hypothetical protein